jgi:lipopolysaccharide biosynthesis glycosyltransferase
LTDRKNEPIVVACAADRRYVMPLAVLLTSLVDCLDPRRALTAYVLDGGIPVRDQELLARSLERPNVRVRWIPSGSAPLPELPVWGRLGSVVYQRLMIPQMLPESVSRAIWLDCDMVIWQDVARLWDLDVGDHYLLAAQDMIVPHVSSFMGIARYEQLGIPASAKYFNAGVMLVNLALWRDHDVVAKVVDYLERYREDVVFLEQEALNAVLAGRWGELDPRWNQNASVTGQPFFRPRHLEAETYERLVRDPWIVHFTGRIKPWTTRKASRSRALYYRYLDETPWAGWRPARRFGGTLVGAYESSRLRIVLYPAEKWGFEAMRRWALRRSRGSGRNGRLRRSPGRVRAARRV